MLKPPTDPDQFKHFRGDPPDVKLQAWKYLQRRYTVRDIVIGLWLLIPFLVVMVKRFG